MISRQPETDVHSLFVERWSPRSFDPHYEISDNDLKILMEAARWAPSSFNEQPWTLHLAKKGTPAYDTFLDGLVEANQAWAKTAPVLGYLSGKKYFSKNHAENVVFKFDCGAAWMSFTLQARMMDLYTHGMGGIVHDKVESFLKIDKKEESVIMAFAIGKAGDPKALPEDLQSMETPNSRKPLSEVFKLYEKL
ncbi:MAG TPA: nitroreductase [Bdellovibrionales bacterium]|nr:nitroreductase [Pseudobdellovibrionaceae bacterium]HAG92363.1 nitroreductase [Bdellovibrionales bacterium]|tara:strand:+ start:758 stop:1336 length:579 start_codon:yes stop_codon:yes gene_type:complete